jgi:Ca-activated chloride channel family protein
MFYWRGFAFVLLAIIAASSSILAQTDDDVLKVDSSIVVMNASVTDAAGKAVAGLKEAQFHIFEDGIEQKIESFGSEETPFAAVILLDTSGSMENRVTLARAAAITFLAGLRATDVAAIYNFDSKVSPVQEFSNSRDIREQVFDLKANGMTVLNDAVYKAAELLSKRAEKRRAIIVLSDGADTMSAKTAAKALKAALGVGATIYAVDMSSSEDVSAAKRQNQGVLKSFADKTGGKFVATPGGVAMRDAFKRIAEELGVQYTITYSPTNSAKDGKWRALELRISRPNLTIRTRKGYHAVKN